MRNSTTGMIWSIRESTCRLSSIFPRINPNIFTFGDTRTHFPYGSGDLLHKSSMFLKQSPYYESHERSSLHCVFISVTTRILGSLPATQERYQKDTSSTLNLKTNISKKQFIQKYAASHNIQKYHIIQNR